MKRDVLTEYAKANVTIFIGETMALSKLAKKRLGTLIKFMRSLPKSANDHFNMDSWFSHSGDHAHTPKDRPITAESLKGCGTTACAAGWAATIPAFRKAGFTYTPTRGFAIDPENFFDLHKGDDWQVSEELFYSFDAGTPKQWASMAEKILRRESK